jgi:hypothetical protein
MRKAVFTTIAAALAVPAGAAPLFPATPKPGTSHYLYQVVQTINGTTHHGWRTEFDLEASNGAVYAVIRKAAELGDAGWKPIAAVDDTCRAAMHGDRTSLARVKIYPLSEETAKDLGPSFMAACAPGGIFFPLTDILNVAIIPLSPRFRTNELRAVGQSLRYPGFVAAFDRAGEKIRETSSGGAVVLAALEGGRAVIDWRPDLADLDMNEQASKPPVALKGTEHWAFRLEIDRKTGIVERASTSYDDLDLAVVGAPASVPHVRISRSVLIERQ